MANELHTYKAYIRTPGAPIGIYQTILTCASNPWEARNDLVQQYGEIFWPDPPMRAN